MAGRSAAAEGEKGRIEATKVQRYRPGQVPHWMRPDQADQDFAPLTARDKALREERALSKQQQQQPTQRDSIATPVIVKKAIDPRLARLAAAAPNVGGDRTAALRERHREVAAPEIVARSREINTEEEEEENNIGGKEQGVAMAPEEKALESKREQEEEECIAARRAALRQQLLDKDSYAGKIQQGKQPEEKESSSEEYTSEESDDEDEYGFHRPLAKPVFVPRVDRETIAEREAVEREVAEECERQRARLEQRKEETREIVAARLAEEEAQAAAAAVGPQGAEDIVTDDEAEGVDPDVEYEGWRRRELSRLARDNDEREREEREAAERERWKAMSEEERQAHLVAKIPEKPKEKWGYLQKYYHRGAFFQTEAEYKGEAIPLVGDVVARDVSAPTGEDRVDKSTLPQVMQVKNFGRRGRTKWTHLVAEDTTDFEALRVRDPALRKKIEARLPGTDLVFTAPKNTKT